MNITAILDALRTDVETTAEGGDKKTTEAVIRQVLLNVARERSGVPVTPCLTVPLARETVTAIGGERRGDSLHVAVAGQSDEGGSLSYLAIDLRRGGRCLDTSSIPR